MYIHKVTNPALQQQRLMLTRKLLSEGDNASSTSESESNEKVSFASVQANTSVGVRDGARVAAVPLQPLHTRSNPTDDSAAVVYASGHQVRMGFYVKFSQSYFCKVNSVLKHKENLGEL